MEALALPCMSFNEIVKEGGKVEGFTFISVQILAALRHADAPCRFLHTIQIWTDVWGSDCV